MYSINVLIICYKQEHLISRALESVLCQKEWGLKNIIIQDDCSPDATWEVLQEYARKYPDIIKPYRNEHNLGIYGNWQALMQNRGEADIYAQLSGDDAYCDGFFKEAQTFMETHPMQPSEPFGIFMDWKVIRANGMENIVRNQALKSNIPAFRLQLRDIIHPRGVLMSRGTVEQYKRLPLEHGIPLAETVADLQKTYIPHHILYVPFVASIYYANIGVSSNLKKYKFNEDSIYKFDHIHEYFDLCDADKEYMQYLKYKELNSRKFTFSTYRQMITYYKRSADSLFPLSKKALTGLYFQPITSRLRLLLKRFYYWTLKVRKLN
jgi:glycosyltransferase involved in cell wall biosynthesis